MKTSSIAKKFSVDEYVNRFFCFMEHVDEGVLVIDANTRAVLKANSSAARLSGFALPELENLHIDDLHTSEELPLLLLEIQRLEFEKQTEIEDFELRHKNGWKCPVDIRLCRLVQEDEDFEHKFFVAFYHFESAEESEPDFSKRNKELVALMEVGQTIASALNFDEILDLTMLKLASVCNARYVSLFLKDDDGSLRMHKAHKNPPEEVSLFDQPWRIGIEEGPYENVDEQNRILQVENVFTDDSFQQWRPIAERIGFGAILSVAMIPRKTSLGVFNVYYEKPKKFTEEEINFLRTAVTYLSISIENARLYKEYQDKADQISAINEITNSINSSLELEEVIKTVALEVKKIMEYDYISISLFDEDSAGLNLYSLGSENLGSKLGEDTWRRLGDFALGWLCTGVKTEKADASAGGELASDYEAKSTIEKELQSKMNVLLLSKDKYLGTFSIGKMERYTYTNTHQTLFKQIAGQVATALENAKLYQEAKRRLTEISALADVSTTITSSLNIREVLDLIVKAAAKAMHAKICMIWFVGDTLHPSRYSNDTDDSFSELEKAFRDKVERVAREKEPLIIDDLRQEDLPDKDVPDFMVPNVLRSYLGVPVISREKTIAVLSVYKEDSHHFDEREVKLLRTIANHAAIAIDNARLYERERRRAAQLAMVNEVGKQITTTLDLDRLLDIVTNSIREIFSYYHVSIY
ncbi:MAG: GAF domain-containing protein, partial [bacterium]